MHNASEKSIVVLLHGIARTSRSMRPIEKALSKQHYKVLNLNYASRKKNLSAISQDIYEQIFRFCNNNAFRVHFVTHSMGGLVLRVLLSEQQITNIGRVVMLTPPNQGSEVADFLQHNKLYQFLYGPAGQQLTTKAASTLPVPSSNFDLGIIAGNKCLDPICYWLLPGEHDGKITVKSTYINPMTDHIVVPYAHSFIMYHKNVIHQVQVFLEQGKFDYALK